MLNMKVIICSCLSSTALICTSSYAASLACPFTDNFQIRAPLAIRVLNTPTVMGNLSYSQEDETLFKLSCGDNMETNSGDLFVDIGADSDNYCTLTIHDGPFVQNPYVTNINCKGKVHYTGIDHVYGTYSYVLKFISC